MATEQKFRSIGFDLGDTLLFYRDVPLNWTALYPDALRAVASRCEVSPTPKQLAATESILARYNTRLAPRTKEVEAKQIFGPILDAWGLASSTFIDSAIEEFFSFFHRRLSAYPDTLSVLKALRERGIKTGILTDVPYGMPRHLVERDLIDTGILDLIDVLLTSVEAGVRKPETGGYIALAHGLGVAPDEMLYVGNEEKDVVGAHKAGMTAVLIDRSNDKPDFGQHLTVSALSQILDIVKP